MACGRRSVAGRLERRAWPKRNRSETESNAKGADSIARRAIAFRCCGLSGRGVSRSFPSRVAGGASALPTLQFVIASVFRLSKIASRESDQKRNRDAAESAEKTAQRASNSLACDQSACDWTRVIESFNSLSFSEIISVGFYR
jgi:hypothetical protein